MTDRAASACGIADEVVADEVVAESPAASRALAGVYPTDLPTLRPERDASSA